MKIFLGILFIFFLGNVFSQGEIVLKSKVKGNEILLRWTPSRSELFQLAVKNGYTLYRKEWNGSGNPTEVFWKTDLEKEIKISIPGKDNTTWKNALVNNNDAGVIYSFLFPEKTRTKSEEQNLFGLALLTCDLNPDLAEMAGLFYKDTAIVKGKKYAYKIEINTLKESNFILVNTDNITELPILNEWNLKNVGKSVELNWNYKKWEKDYSGYFIERSSDSIHYEKMNQRAFIPMASQYEKGKEICFYSDTAVKENEWYWYRLIGQDHFGEKGIPSLPLKVFIYPDFKGEIDIDTLYESKNGKAYLKWQMTDKKDVSITNKIRIMYSTSIAGKYEVIKELKVNETEFEFELSHRMNYFKVVALNGGSQMESWPYLFLIPDRFPPVAPDSLIGAVDRQGKVTLQWKRNPEMDLLGYRVFRSNSLQEEMVEVSKRILTVNEFVDSVDIKSLTEEIYFSVNVVDSNYNNSPLSLPIKIKKPDYIAPTIAPIVELKATEDGNIVRWNRSTSTDVYRTELRRSLDGKIFEKLISFGDTTQCYLDSSIRIDQGYHYRTVVMDDANNFSESEIVYMENPKLKISFSDSVNVVVDRKDKFIFFQWMPLKEEVYSYIIYKAKKGESLRSFKTVEGNICSIKDTELYLSNEYVYSIKAVLKSGREVMIKEELNVIY